MVSGLKRAWNVMSKQAMDYDIMFLSIFVQTISNASLLYSVIVKFTNKLYFYQNIKIRQIKYIQLGFTVKRLDMEKSLINIDIHIFF